MKMCSCSHHCCHEEIVQETIEYEENGYRVSFIRKKCKKCGLWMGDGVPETKKVD